MNPIRNIHQCEKRSNNLDHSDVRVCSLALLALKMESARVRVGGSENKFPWLLLKGVALLTPVLLND